MKYSLLIISIFVIVGCQEQAGNNSKSVSQDAEVKKQVVPKSVNVRDTFDCKIFGKKEKGSDRWLAEKEMYFAMTNDIFLDEMPKFTSYNVFQVYNTLNCNLIYNGKLPEVADLVSPYKLQTDIYEPINQLVCSQSPEKVYCYHVGRKEIIIPLSPPLAKSKVGTYDPNLSRDLTTWGNYLFGWTEKIGAYAFDMTNPQNPSTVRYSGTYSTRENTNYLFVLKTNDGIQLLVSEIKDNVLTMHPLLDKPKNLNRKVYRDKSGGRYAFLKSIAGNEFVAVDLAQRKTINLPKEVMESTLAVKSYLNSLN